MKIRIDYTIEIDAEEYAAAVARLLGEDQMDSNEVRADVKHSCIEDGRVALDALKVPYKIHVRNP